MTIAAIVPVGSMSAANAALDASGFGPRNFSVPGYASASATHGGVAAWDDPALLAALLSLTDVTVGQSDDPPDVAFAALFAVQGAAWGDHAPLLPSSGSALAGTLYRYEDGTLWWCIQTFDRSVYSAHPSTYPALIRIVREPGTISAWTQPIDQYDAYKLTNPFTGLPDECMHAGKHWAVTQADGSGNNVWEPGVYGWSEVSMPP
jgi:hypothetical protein